MASTKTLQNVMDWASPFIFGRPQTINGSEPALTSANTILTTVLAAPFRWRWNRATATPITCVPGTQDYSAAISDFGFLEGASVSFTGDPTFEIAYSKLYLGVGSGTTAADRGRPDNIAAQLDDNAGNITFRTMKIPDKAYTVTPTYQKKAALLTGTSSTWAPIPDEFSYIYNAGYLGMILMYADDPRWMQQIARFKALLVSAAEGLDETQKNIFLESWLINTAQQQKTTLTTQMGVQDRNA